MDALQCVELIRLMKLTSGRPEITIGLIDGPVAMNHPDLTAHNFRELAVGSGACSTAMSGACMHGTFVAGMLLAEGGASGGAICLGVALPVGPPFWGEA